MSLDLNNMTNEELERYYYQQGETRLARTFEALVTAQWLLRCVLREGLTLETMLEVSEFLGDD